MTEQQLDQFNQQLRGNPRYQQYLQSLGVNTNVAPGQAWRLSDQQRKQAESWVRSNVGDLGDLEIDISGNANQNEGFGKQLKRYGPIAGGVALSLFGIPGVFNGLLNSGAPAAAGAGGAAFDAAPAISSAQGAANAASLGWTVPGAMGGAAIPAAATSAIPAAATIATRAAEAAGPFSVLKGLALPMAINAGANVVGAALSSRAANNAAESQIEAGDRALAFLREQYGDAKTNLAPYMTAGTQALNTVSSALPTQVPVRAYGVPRRR
jgi:hypothetical protein